uniref:M23ase beta-sheet core domain-containing protein n=1 Tax=candidate division WOR-3 bacterium TaxID=2052148 RepID=A0A7C4TGZ8_UNCW3
MMKKGISVIISPTNSGISKHFFLSQRMIFSVLGIFIIFLVFFVYTIINYSALSYRAFEATLLKRRNAEIEKEFAKLEEIKRNLKLAEMNNEKIKIMLGVEKSPPPVEPEFDKLLPDNTPQADTVSKTENIPYLFPTVGQISKHFGENHRGIDIAAPILSPVIATASGRVIETGWDSLYGNYLIIENSKNYTTFFGHLNSIAVKKDESVMAGAVIGTVGSSGVSTSPHLHYEVRFRGVPVDPMAYLPTQTGK